MRKQDDNISSCYECGETDEDYYHAFEPHPEKTGAHICQHCYELMFTERYVAYIDPDFIRKEALENCAFVQTMGDRS